MPIDPNRPQAAAGQPGDEDAPRVLVVHHSKMRALLTEHLLAAAGCVVRTLADTRELAAAMESFQPDLILSAAPIAEAGGVELAAIARGPDSLRLVPILMAAVDHRRQPRADTLGPGAAADGSPLLAPELLVDAVTRRIASLRAMSRPLPALDHLDPDTGLTTRRHFMHCVSRAIAEPDIAQPGNGLLVVALDGVGQLNEQLGTGAADLAAEHVGRLIGEQLGQTQLAVRLDDYRHALLVRRPGAEALREVTEALRCVIADSPFAVSGNPVTTSVSIGIGLFRPAADDLVTMIKRAERACAQAAADGGNQVVVERPIAAQDEAQERQLTQLIERALSDADEVGGFRIFYQPMVAIGRQVLWHVEVMLCLAAPDGTLIQAADFLPAAERAGRVAEVDRWIMLRSLAVLVQEGPVQPRLRLFVRQHVASLIEDGWLSWFRDQVSAHDLAERGPILDLDVQDLLGHHHLAGTLIASLRKTGIQVCLAGVDHTPVVLELVRELHPPFVKLAAATHQLRPDRLHHLVRRLRHGQTAVIACGIDSHDLVAPVWASGVDYAQGTIIHALRPQLDFDWDEVVTEQTT